MFKDYYSILQVHPDAEADIVQSAYKRLSRKYHPDVNPSPYAAEKQLALNEAYEILNNPVKRAAYHKQWQFYNKPKAPASATKTIVEERIIYRTPEPPRFGGGTEGAFLAVQNYFNGLSALKFKEAYSLLSDYDKELFAYGAFVEWQDSVSAIYEIGNIRIKLFRRHDIFKIDNDTRLPAEEYTVSILEKTKKTGVVNEYKLNKYAVFENGVWKIYLGYRDLAPLTLQFKTMLATREEAQIIGLWEKYKDTTDFTVGLPNYTSFCESMKREEYRSKRYGRPFSVAVVAAALPDRLLDREMRERVLRYMGYIINNSVRDIDSVSYLEDMSFGILLAETPLDCAGAALTRILRMVKHDIAACFDFSIDIRAGAVEYDGSETDALLELCRRDMKGFGFVAGEETIRQTS